MATATVVRPFRVEVPEEDLAEFDERSEGIKAQQKKAPTREGAAARRALWWNYYSRLTGE